MLSRTVQDIEADIQAIKADIQAVKDSNPNWFKDAGEKGITKSFNDSLNLIIEREIGTASGESPQKLISLHK